MDNQVDDLRRVVNAQADWNILEVDATHKLLKTGDDFTPHDGERLPFEDATYDAVLCRGVNQVADIYRFAVEAARVLKVGGVLALHDVVLPEDKRAREYINAFYQLCQPTRLQAYAESEWRGTLLDIGLSVEQVESSTQRLTMRIWAQDCSAYVIERLHILLAQAPRAVEGWLKPSCIGTADAEFDETLLLMTGKKSE